MTRVCTVTLFGVALVVLALVGGAAQAKKKRAPAKAPKVALTCKVDADCALTRMDDGQCCPMLCQPRAVAKASAEALEKYAATCEKPGNAKMCPAPPCAPPRVTLEAACVSGKCETRAAAGGSRD
jgi:hypothetical protein